MAMVKFQGESDEDSDKVEDYMVSARKKASETEERRWQAAEARLEEQRSACLELQRKMENGRRRKAGAVFFHAFRALVKAQAAKEDANEPEEVRNMKAMETCLCS